MRIVRDKLIFMGLASLDEVCVACQREPHPGGFALRTVLAMLYALSSGSREPFDDFYTTCTQPNDPNGKAELRGTYVWTAFHGVCRALGVVEDIRFGMDLAAARSDRPDTPFDRALRNGATPAEVARHRFAKALYRSEAERRARQQAEAEAKAQRR